MCVIWTIEHTKHTKAVASSHISNWAKNVVQMKILNSLSPDLQYPSMTFIFTTYDQTMTDCDTSPSRFWTSNCPLFNRCSQSWMLLKVGDLRCLGVGLVSCLANLSHFCGKERRVFRCFAHRHSLFFGASILPSPSCQVPLNTHGITSIIHLAHLAHLASSPSMVKVTEVSRQRNTI